MHRLTVADVYGMILDLRAHPLAIDVEPRDLCALLAGL